MRILGDRYQGHGSIRTRLTAVVVFSAVALVVMWAAVSVPRLYDAIYLRAVSEAMQQVMPKATKALSAVQTERAQSLAANGSAGSLPATRTASDQSVREVQELVEPLLGRSPQVVQDKYAEWVRILAELPGVRGRVDSKSVGRPELYGFYNRVADVSIDVFSTMARVVPDQETAFSGVQVTSLFRGADLMSRASTVASGAISGGTMNSADHAEFARLTGAYRYQLELSTQNASESVRTAYQDLRDSDSWKRLTAAEDLLISSGEWTVVTGRTRTEGQVAASPVSEQDWRDVTGKVYADLEQLGVTQFADTAARADDKSGDSLLSAIIGSAIALLVAVLTIVAAMRIMRRTTRRLTKLRYETLDLAVEKLPPIVQRLRAGEQVDVSTELPALDFGKDEIGQVARAFNAAHSTAVEAAVQESQARAGIRNVFLGIAHRSQALVHRQLKILDKLEREQEDPQQLDELFTLDHLATRARRNAENLIILGGQQPGRAWRKPVLLADVLRGAIAETTQYKRIRLQGVPRVLVAGSAVADTMHLVAELLDNATSFSPPQAQVRLYGEPAAKGIVVEVEDNGLGMDDEERDRRNAVLADPPDFEAMALKGDPRLGLFVVARLAARHGVKVELRSSSYGGTRAIVLIPATLLVEDDHQDDTAVLNPVPAARTPDPDYVDDMMPFRVSLFAPADAGEHQGGEYQGGEQQTATGTQVEDPPELWQEPAPAWPEQEVVEPPPAEPSVNTMNTTGTAEGISGTEKPVLPRRRRQASLAPQLRETKFEPVETEADLDDGRSPEEIRGIMSAFQHESRRARDEDHPWES